jgi:SAM-dependent methyltransferase
MTAMWVELIIALGAAFAIAGAGELLRRRLRAARNDHSRRPTLWNRFYGLKWGETATNNYGFAPAEGEQTERPQHQMYRELLRRLAAVRPLTNGLALLEVSCGRGGGLVAFLDAAPTATFDATGLDVAQTAIHYCHSRYAERRDVRFVQGNALDLPFPAHSFDVVLNVEASNDYGDRALFFREVARVLRPDGVFLYTDTCHEGRACDMDSELSAAGFKAEFDDITANVIEACRLDSPRRRETIRNAPLLARVAFRGALANYAAIEGSDKFGAFQSGRRRYRMTAATHA